MDETSFNVPLLSRQQQEEQPPPQTSNRFYEFFNVPLVKLPPFIFSFVLFALAIYTMAFVQVVIEDFSIHHKINRSAVVYDTIFNILPHAREAHLADYYTVGFMVLVFLIVLFNRRLRIMVDIIRRTLFVMAIVYFCRTISISITLLPNPFKLCKSEPISNYFLQALWIVVGASQTCHDTFFSGHSVAICLAAMTFFDYLNANLVIRLLIIPAAIAGALIIISTHFHYSVDVMFGFLLSFLFWKYFHMIVHHIERFLVRRREVATEKLSYIELTKEFLATEVGQVESKVYVMLIEPLEHRQSTDSFHVLLTSMWLRFVIWFETLGFLLEHLPSL
jgi:hypothetical protein